MQEKNSCPSSPIRFQFSAKKKLKIVNKYKRSKLAYSSFAKNKNIHVNMIKNWVKNEDKLLNSPKKSIRFGSGKKPLYPDIEDDLYGWILNKRADGLEVKYQDIKNNAIVFFKSKNGDGNVPTFSNKWIAGFLKRYNLTLRKVSSCRIKKDEDEHIFNEYKSKFNDLIIKNKIKTENIYNMDETGIFFNMSSDTTVDFVGAKKVSIIKNYASKTRFTCVLTISASGHFLKPMLIFKGINLTKQMKKISDIHNIHVQENAWMNIGLMKNYIDTLPFSDENKLMIMDEFICHKNPEILSLLQAKNYLVLFVPKGYTDLLQPLDVGIMKPFKGHLKFFFREWMHQEGIIGGKAKCPSKELMCEWVKKSIEKITPVIIKNSFNGSKIELPEI